MKIDPEKFKILEAANFNLERAKQPAEQPRADKQSSLQSRCLSSNRLRYSPACGRSSKRIRLFASFGNVHFVQSSQRMAPQQGALFVQPNRRKILVDEMTGADLPALDVGPVWDDSVPPHEVKRMHLLVEDALLELAHQLPLFGGLGLAQHRVIKRHLLRILEEFVVVAVIGIRQIGLHIERRVDDGMAVGA